jgi:aspartate dehydrogenase
MLDLNVRASEPDVRVAIAGLGSIGKTIAAYLGMRRLPGHVLTAVAARNVSAAAEFVSTFTCPVSVVGIGDLGNYADVVVEAAPAELFPLIAEPALRAKKTVIVLSAGALLSNDHLIQIAKEEGGTILVPTGSIVGLDAVIAAAEGDIQSVRMISRKPPSSFVGTPFSNENGTDLEGLAEPRKIFAGNAREAVKEFPAILNIGAALALAGIGPERTFLEVWADPKLERNVHRIEVVSDLAILDMTIENIQSDDPKTVKIVSRSVIALLRKMNGHMRIGT